MIASAREVGPALRVTNLVRMDSLAMDARNGARFPIQLAITLQESIPADRVILELPANIRVHLERMETSVVTLAPARTEESALMKPERVSVRQDGPVPIAKKFARMDSTE